MLKKIKNPLSVLFGAILQDLRSKYNVRRADQICVPLEITASAYRMIESGNANFNTSKIPELLEIDVFHSLRFDKVSKFLIAVHVLESHRTDRKKMADAVEKLCDLDNEFQTIFGHEKFSIDEIFENEGALAEFYSNRNVIEATHKFLTNILNVDVASLTNDIAKIKGKSLCIFQPTIETAVKQYEKAINDLQNIGSLEQALSNLEADVSLIRDIQIGYLRHNAIRWRNKHQFISQTGVLYKYANLANKSILLDFEDNLTQLWSHSFIELKYVAVADNKKEVLNAFSQFKKILKEIYHARVSEDGNGPEFEIGFKKIKFYLIPPNSMQLPSIGLTNNKNELWLYQDTQYHYGFRTELIPPSGNNKNNLDNYEYVILTTAETKFYYENIAKVIADAELLHIK